LGRWRGAENRNRIKNSLLKEGHERRECGNTGSMGYSIGSGKQRGASEENMKRVRGRGTAASIGELRQKK